MADELQAVKQYTVEMEKLASTLDKVIDKSLKLDQVQSQSFRRTPPYDSYKEPIPATGMLSRIGKMQIGGSRQGYYSNQPLEEWYGASLGRNQFGNAGEKLSPFPASDFKTSMAAKLKILEEAYNQEIKATRNVAAIKERWGQTSGANPYSGISGYGGNGKGIPALAPISPILTDEQTRVSGDPRYANALKMAGSAGLGIQNLKKVAEGGTAGIQELTFAMEKNGQVTQRLTAYVDTLGNTTIKTGHGFRTFGQDLLRNIESFAMWSLALAVVYAPLQKLNEALDSMIKTQTQLATVTIAMGNVHKDVMEIFREASNVANTLGVSVSEIVDVYANAYRATAGYADANVRAAVTNRLLTDSMLLAKLSGRSQAESLDDLVAAIEQTGVGLGNGQVLLDKWIRTTQLANVDLDTLVTSFGIVASAADNAGISVDELNGLIAAIAQITTFTAKESGNFARALVSGLQQEGAADLLKQIGIDLSTYSDYYQVFLDIYKKIQSGEVDPQSQIFKDITKAIGGGTRRQAPTSALFENMDKAERVKIESIKAQGQAQTALEKQLGTVGTALTRLDNAFKSLAATMGMEGGVLSSVKFFTDVLTTTINLLDEAIAATGSLIPQIAILGAAFAAIKSPQIGGFLTDIGVTTKMKGAIPVIAGFGMSAMNIGQSFMSGDKDKATAQIIGGVIGTAIGATFGPLGMSIGSVIGTNAGSAFTDFMKVDDSMSGIIYDLWKESTAEGTEDGIVEGTTKAQAKIAAYSMIGGEALSRLGIDNAPEWLKQFTGKGIVTGVQAASAFNGLPSDETAGIVATLTARQMVLQRAASGGETDEEYQKRVKHAKDWGLPVPVREGALTPEQQKELEDLTKLLELIKGMSFGVGLDASKAGKPNVPGEETPALFEMPKGGISRYENLTKAQTQLLVKEANKELVDALKAAGASEEEVTTYLASLEGALIETKEGWLNFEKGSSFDPSFLTKAFDNLVKAGKLPGSEMSIEKLSISSGQSGELKKQLSWAGNLLTGMGYKMKPEELGIIFSDYVTTTLHADSMQLRLALERIAEIEQKQLDGMYNLPEGSTFWVPLGAMGLRPTDSGLGGAAGNLNSAAQNLNEAAHVLVSKPYIDSSQMAWLPAGDKTATSGPNYNPYDPRTRPMSIGSLAVGEAPATSGPNYNPYDPRTSPITGSKLSAIGNATGPIDTSPITRIQLEIKDNITLTVDGRQMANVVKQYLWEDMVRAEKSSGIIKRQLVM